MATIILYPGNEQKLQLRGLVDDSGAFINTAVVKATMSDHNGVVIPELNNVTLASIDSNGNYSYTVPATFNPSTSPSSYTCVITATVGGTLKLTINQAVTVSPRTN